MEQNTGQSLDQLLTTQMDVRLREIKLLEWIFIGIRWLCIVLLMIISALKLPESQMVVFLLTGILILVNIIGCYANVKINTLRSQLILSIVLLTVDAVMALGVIFQFVGDFNTAAYAIFAYIIIEAAIRFELVGSLSALVFYLLGLYGAYSYRRVVHDIPFSYTGYAFWATLMTIITVSTGTIVHTIKNQRLQNERHLIAITRLLEQQRIAHDINVKNIAELENMEPLTTREREVITLIAQGKSNREIAAELGIEEKTVKNYINNIYSKLQIKTRYEAITYLFKRPN